VKGYNNALVTSATSPLTLAHDSRDAAAGGCSAGDTACVNGSDVLVLRYQSAEGIAGSGLSDGAMINCAGQSELTAPAGSQARMVSILHVAKTASGEPALMCTAQSGGGWTTVPMVQGVESFQVLYGVDNVNPGAAPAGTTDSVPNRYLRADQLDVAANPVATNGNWRRVRTVRIGMVLRGPRNSAQDRGQAHRAYYPLGESLRSDADPGTTFTPSADGRLRHVLSFTLNLRNDQSLQ
jgi:type IV pilus assembly protein PilW